MDAAILPEVDQLGEVAALVDRRVEPVKRDLLGSVAYDLPVQANSWVEAEIDFLVGQRREVIARWMERGDHYEPFIKSVLRTHNLPTDLFYLGMIESAFVPNARSRAGAVGFWQFMPGTGRALGLRVDSLVDERMDPVRSTRAAARHLRGLKGALGDWALAAAAYNAGSGRISRGLAYFRVDNFWDLAQYGDLAKETRHYVPRLYAMTVIARNRERFGFNPAPPAGERFAFDSVQVEIATPLGELARLGGATVDQLARLNPHLLRGTTPAGGYWVWVPAGQGMALQRAWLASEFRREGGHGTYAVRKGDTLGKLAELSGVEPSRIRELNPGVDWQSLRTGDRLRFPERAARSLAARPTPKKQDGSAGEAARLAVRENGRGDSRAGRPDRSESSKPAARTERSSSPDSASSSAKADRPARAEDAGKSGGRVVHQVREGETLWSIARRYQVEVAALREANELNGSTIVPGRELRIPGAARQAGSDRRAAARDEHVVKTGESLWAIARRYGSTVEAIQSANDLGERSIQPGMKLTIPASR